VALAAGLMASAYAGRHRLFAPRLEALIRETLREETGLEVAIGSVSGSYLRDLEIRDVRTLRPSPAGPVSTLAVQRVRLRYSLSALLRGLNAFVAAAAIEADSLHLDIDLDKLQAAGPAATDSSLPGAFPAVLPVLRLRNATIVLSLGDYRVRCEGGELETSAAPEGRIALELSLPRMEASRRSHPDADIEHLLAGELQLRAEARWPPSPMETASADMSLRLTGRGRADAQPVHAEAAARLSDGRLLIDRLDLSAARSRAVVTEAGAPWSAVAAGKAWPLLQAGSGAFSLFTDDLPGLLAAAGVAAARDERGIPDHELTLVGRLDAGTLSVAKAALLSAAAAIRLEGLETRLDPDALESPLAATLTADVPDLSSIASIFSGPPIAGSLQAQVVLNGTLGRPQGSADLSARGVSVGTTPIGTLRLKAEADQQRARIEAFELLRGEDRLTGKGVIRLPEVLLENTDLVFFIRDIGPYSKLLPAAWAIDLEWLQVQGEVRGSAGIAGRWQDPDGTLELNVRDLRLRGQRFGNGSARLRKQRQEIMIDPAALAFGDDRLFLQGRYNSFTHTFGDAKLELAAGDITPYLAAFGITSPALSGRTALSVAVSGPWTQPDFKLEGDLARMHSADWVFTGTRIRAAGSGGKIRVDAIESLTPFGSLRLAGSLAAGQAEGDFVGTLERLELQGDVSLALTRPVFLRIDSPGTLTIADFEATGPQGRISAQGTLSLHGKSDLSVRLSEVSGRGWLAKRIGAPIHLEGLTAALRAAGSLEAPDITAVGSIRELGLERAAGLGAARFDLAYFGERLQIQTLALAADGGEALRVAGTLPVNPMTPPALRPGRLSLQAELNIPDQERLRVLFPAWPFVSGSLKAELAVAGSWQDPAAVLRWSGRDLAPSDAVVLPPGPYEALGEASLQGGRLNLESLTLKAPDAAVVVRGELIDIPGLPELVAGQPGGCRGRVSLTAALRLTDLGWAARALDGVRRTAGQIEAEAVLEGLLDDPELTADVRLTGGELRPEADLPPLHHLELKAALRGPLVEIRSLQGELGGAPFELTGTLHTGRLPEPRADLELKGDNLLLFRSETVTLRADTRLKLSGPVSRLKLEGEAAITDGRLSTRWRFLDTFLKPERPASVAGLRLFSIQTPPFRDMQFQVRISSRTPFQVRTNVARGEVRPQLLLAGTGEDPVLTGVVYVDPGRLTLPSTTLKIESGLIRFLPSDPERPVVNLMGSGRVYGYDITLRVEGPYDAPEIFLSSVPPLAHEELLWMLLTGEPPRQEAALSESQQAGMKVAVYVGRDFITHWLESALPESEESVLDRLDVEVGRSVSRTGQQTIEARFRLAKGFIRRGEALYLVGEKDIYDTYNMGVRLVFRFQ
jgi:hypothetical protein